MSGSLTPWAAMLGAMPGVVDEVAACVAANEEMWQIARRLGVTRGQLSYWLTSDADRALKYAAAYKAASHDMILEGRQKAAQADALANRATRIAGLATEDTLGGSKLEADACLKAAGVKMGIAKFNVDIAGLLNPADYGRRVHVEHGGGVSLDAGLTLAMGDLLERVVGGGSIVAEETVAPALVEDTAPVAEEPVWI